MKKLFLFSLLALIGVTQSGCFAWLSGAGENKVTTTTIYRQDKTVDRVVVAQELSNDAVYYQEAGKVLASSGGASECKDCTPGEKVALEAFSAIKVVSGKAFVDRGMSGVEALASVGNNVVNHSPYGIFGFMAYEYAKRPGVNMSGDNAVYAPFENHQTGSDGSSVTIPYRYDSPDTTTITDMVE